MRARKPKPSKTCPMQSDPFVSPESAAVRGLQEKLRASIRAAWIDGHDFTHGPFETVGTDPFSTRSLFDQWTVEITCKGGPCSRRPDGTVDVINGWAYYPRPDFSESELIRFTDGRHDWRDSDWQDHCGLPGCELCERGEVAAHAHITKPSPAE